VKVPILIELDDELVSKLRATTGKHPSDFLEEFILKNIQGELEKVAEKSSRAAANLRARFAKPA
jgi:hypothetical protein